MSLYVKILILFCILLIVVALFTFIDVDLTSMKKTAVKTFIIKINNFVTKYENNLRQKMFRGQLSPLMFKWNRFLNNLKTDIEFFNFLPLIHFKFILYTACLILGFLISFLLFSSFVFIIPLAIMILIALLSFMFSITVRTRYIKLVDCITAENILSANVNPGTPFVTNVNINFDSIPSSIKPMYRDFVYNMENINYDLATALQILDMDTGYYSTRFFSDVLTIYTNYQEGLEDIFKDTVELNSIRIMAREKMEILIKMISMQFIFGFIISYGLFLVELFLMGPFRNFYLHFPIGQVLFVFNLVLLVFIYMAISMIKGVEL